MRPLVFTLFLFLFCALHPVLAVADSNRALLIASASNFRFVLEEIKLALPFDLKVSYASTGKLSTQIQNGAPFDVFLSAKATKDHPELSKYLRPSTTSSLDFAKGSVVAWSPRFPILDLHAKLANPDNTLKIAYANPKLAPYGFAAKNALTRLGIDQARHKILRPESVSQVFQLAQRNTVDLAFVALSQVKGASLRRALTIPHEHIQVLELENLHPLIHSVFLLKNSEPNPLAHRFLDFLRSDQGVSMLEQFGYQSIHPRNGPRQ